MNIYSQISESTQLHANICQAVADPKRIQILYALADKSRQLNVLADDLGFPQSTISRHLRVLRQQSLVQKERTGVYVTYQLADHRIIQALNTIRQVMVDAVKEKTAVFD